MKRFALIAGSCLSLIPAAAVAQSREPMPAPAPAAATATPTVGATVLDSAGVSIGTIASITPQAIVLDMDGTKIAVPPTSVGATAKGLAMAMTKADLQAAQAQQQAAAKAAVQSRLVAGAAVAGLNGAPVGTIKSTSGDMVTMTTGKGDVVLPATGFTANATGQLIIGMTQAQLDAAMGGAGSATTPSTTSSTGGAASSATATPTSTTSTGVSGTADATGSATMTPPATPATTTAPAPKASVSTRTTTKVTTKKKSMTPK